MVSCAQLLFHGQLIRRQALTLHPSAAHHVKPALASIDHHGQLHACGFRQESQTLDWKASLRIIRYEACCPPISMPAQNSSSSNTIHAEIQTVLSSSAGFANLLFSALCLQLPPCRQVQAFRPRAARQVKWCFMRLTDPQAWHILQPW